MPEILIGTFAPGGGDPYNGMGILQERVFETPSIQVSPRLGFALDIFGNGKTAMRGGFGMFPGRVTDNMTFLQMHQIPQVNTFAVYYRTIKDLLNSPRVFSSSSVLAVQTKFDLSTVYKWSFGIQQNVGFSTVLDVAYVGSGGRHLTQRRSLNATQYGTNLLASSIDPTLTGNWTLPVDFRRPIKGYADMQYLEFAGTSNYHCMQVQANRRFKQNLTFGLSWTWSKSMILIDAVQGLVEMEERDAAGSVFHGDMQIGDLSEGEGEQRAVGEEEIPGDFPWRTRGRPGQGRAFAKQAFGQPEIVQGHADVRFGSRRGGSLKRQRRLPSLIDYGLGGGRKNLHGRRRRAKLADVIVGKRSPLFGFLWEHGHDRRTQKDHGDQRSNEKSTGSYLLAFFIATIPILHFGLPDRSNV